MKLRNNTNDTYDHLRHTHSINSVLEERMLQDETWGIQQDHTSEWWLAILMEEVGELAKELNQQQQHSTKEREECIREELVQVAATALNWLECVDRQRIEYKEILIGPPLMVMTKRQDADLDSLAYLLNSLPTEKELRCGRTTLSKYVTRHREVYDAMRRILNNVDVAEQNDSDAPPLDKKVENFVAFATAAAIHQAAGGKLTWDNIVQTLGKQYDLDQFPNPETVSQEEAKNDEQTQETISITLPGNYSDPEYCLGQGRHFIRRTDNDKKRFQFLGPKGWTYQADSILYFQNQSDAEAVLAILPQQETTLPCPPSATDESLHQSLCNRSSGDSWMDAILEEFEQGHAVTIKHDQQYRWYAVNTTWGADSYNVKIRVPQATLILRAIYDIQRKASSPLDAIRSLGVEFNFFINNAETATGCQAQDAVSAISNQSPSTGDTQR